MLNAVVRLFSHRDESAPAALPRKIYLTACLDDLRRKKQQTEAISQDMPAAKFKKGDWVIADKFLGGLLVEINSDYYCENSKEYHYFVTNKEFSLVDATVQIIEKHFRLGNYQRRQQLSKIIEGTGIVIIGEIQDVQCVAGCESCRHGATALDSAVTPSWDPCSRSRALITRKIKKYERCRQKALQR
jgi:hypothetical protein